MSATSGGAVGWRDRQNASKCYLHFQPCHPRRSVSCERRPQLTMRHKVRDSADAFADDSANYTGFRFGTVQAKLCLPRSTILLAQDVVSRGEIGFADARSAPLDAPSCARRIALRLQGKQSLALNRSKAKKESRCRANPKRSSLVQQGFHQTGSR